MRVLFRFLASMMATAVRRLRHGPLRPSWAFPFEGTVAFLRATTRAGARLGPVEERALWASLKSPRSRVFEEVRTFSAVAGGVPAMWVEPLSCTSELVIIYAHGGSFIYGSLVSHAELVARLAVASGARVLAIDYRLAPEHPFPAALDDMVSAYRWLLAEGTPAQRIVFAGDSAGGNLVVTAMLRAREQRLALPAAGLMLSPWVDLTRRGGSLESNQVYDWGIAEAFPRWAALYAAGHDLRDPLVSPIFADLRELPPLLVMNGEAEMLRDQIEELVAEAARAGVAVEHECFPDMIHNWVTLHGLTSQAQRGFDRAAAFLKSLRERDARAHREQDAAAASPS